MYSEKNIILRASAATDAGSVRGTNEDNFYLNGTFISSSMSDKAMLLDISEADSFFLFAVSDGMGGEKHGKKASLTAMQELKKAHNLIKSNNDGNIDCCTKRINSYIKNTNNLIYNLSLEYGARIGTTFASLVLFNGQVQALNLGDSRIYHFRKNEMIQLTKDHTEAERLMRLGVLSPEEASNSPTRNQLSKYLGISPQEGTMEADFSESFPVEKGDVFLLCSDGLTSMVKNEQIKDIIKTENMPSKIASLFINEALKNGGVDNITCIVVRIEDILA